MNIVTVKFDRKNVDGVAIRSEIRLESLGPNTTTGIVLDAVSGEIAPDFGKLISITVEPDMQADLTRG